MESVSADQKMDLASNDNLASLWQKQMTAAGSDSVNTKRKREELHESQAESESEECDSEVDLDDELGVDTGEGIMVTAAVSSTDEVILPSVLPKRKRRKKTRKYATFCKKMDIPYPTVSRRESEHLDLCQTCQEAWPLFFYQQSCEMKLSFEDVVKAWMEIPESERQRKHKVLAKAEVAWLKNLVKTRPPTGYQIFLKEKRQGNHDLQKINFGDRTKIIAKLWGGLNEAEKKVYTDASVNLKKERRSFIEGLPSFKRKRYEAERKKFKNNLKSKRPPKPCNSFMLYLSDRWKAEKGKGTTLKYRDMMQLASHEWENTLTEEDKVPYRRRFVEAKETYFVTKQKMKDKRKLVQQSRKTVSLTDPPKLPPLPELSHSGGEDGGGTDDEMST